MIMTVVLDIRRVVADVLKNIGLKCHVHNVMYVRWQYYTRYYTSLKTWKIVEFDIFHALNIQEFRQRSWKNCYFLSGLFLNEHCY